MAPSSRAKYRAKQDDVVFTPQERAKLDSFRAERQEAGDHARAKYAQLEKMSRRDAVTKAKLCNTTLEVARDITYAQSEFLSHWQTDVRENPHRSPLETFQLNFQAYIELFPSTSLDDIYDLSFTLRNKGSVGCAKTGRQMVNLCAELGHAEAVIQVVASALRQSETNPSIMRSRPVMIALDRLRTVSKTGNLRAIVMEANVARHANQVNRAITLYEQALDLISKDDGSQMGDKYSKIRDELSSPWIELGFLHHTRGEYVAAMKAYVVGQEQDDPMAYFNLARLDKFMTGGQYTHDWLYNITKAAASGHFIAAFELGEYYANSAAPSEPQTSFLDKLKGFGSFLWKSNLNLNPKANIHHHDAFANKPELRIKLAHQWLWAASVNYYLPASIALAELHLQQFIYPEGTLTKQLDLFGDSTDPTAIVNPLFDPRKAQARLTEVLTACQTITEAKRVSTTNAEYLHTARPWSYHAEILEAIEGKETLQDLKEQAEMIADAAGIDLYSTDELPAGIPRLGILRLHKGTRGEGMCEMPSSTKEQGEEAAKRSG
ncbi:unnamed protein product [Aureobasidium mustum]|uniref:TPR-like protein n=1 Tax=Aureobasidium mustum TaxID=2773714 RepID=A0A9N8PLT9_9PEZI|nr:unnamed protein product [Aureobasidium mustum]